MKKPMPGFVPVNYKTAGKIILTIGMAGLLAELLSYITGWFALSNYIIYLSLGLIVLSLYLMLIVPKN